MFICFKYYKYVFIYITVDNLIYIYIYIFRFILFKLFIFDMLDMCFNYIFWSDYVFLLLYRL